MFKRILQTIGGTCISTWCSGHRRRAEVHQGSRNPTSLVTTTCQLRGAARTAAERKETHSLRSPPPDKRFLLDLLEGVLLQRSAAFYRLPSLAFALKNKVGRVAGHCATGSEATLLCLNAEQHSPLRHLGPGHSPIVHSHWLPCT